MAPRKRLPETASKLKSAKRAKSKESSGIEVPKRRSARLSRKTHAIVHLENGLLSMENTPEYLVEVVKLNAVSSPLLRLPAEIRDKIWKLAMTGYLVYVREDENKTQVDPKTWRMVLQVFSGKSFVRTGPGAGKKCRVQSAFHLPEVCRQMYSETVTLGYSLNVFAFEALSICTPFEFVKSWAASLTSAHRNAIADIELQSFAFEEYTNRHCKIKLREIFLGLKRIHVNDSATSLIGVYGDWDEDAQRPAMEDREGWKKWMRKKVNQKEGDDVQLIIKLEETSSLDEDQASETK